jgi:integrase
MIGDGFGLYLQITERGSKSWILRYKRDGKSHYLGLGPLHTFGLGEARDRAIEARKLLAVGEDPIRARRASRAAAKQTKTFNECATATVAAHRAAWGERNLQQWESSLVAYVAPIIGDMPVQAVDTEAVMLVLGDLWLTKPETAVRVRGRIEAVLDWATARGLRSGENPAAWRRLRHLLPARSKVRPVVHLAALPYREIGGFVSLLRQRNDIKARALEFTILTAVRSNEAPNAQWSEFSLGENLWTIPAGRMKAARAHRVPLSDRAVAILRELAAVRTSSDFVFPGRKSGRPIGENAFFNLLREIGRSEITAHGFRSTFRDWAGSETSFPRELAEEALAHVTGDATERAYRRSDALERRRKLMDAWAAFVETSGRGKVIPFARG